MDEKKIRARLKMRLKGGQASAAPPVGSTLGQHRVNMMDFINPFNEATKDRQGEDLTVHIFIHEDNTMAWRIVGKPTDELIREALKVEKGSGKPNIDKLEEKLTQAQLTEIAAKKLADTNTDRLDSIKKMVAGTARSMGIEVEEQG
ncbi:50S ribosomal protein L11 [Candidatus Saccharibacteria bacterium]|nr:50S ribosomal protein L11 [Candidatus Saccharibacteria bacterium]